MNFCPTIKIFRESETSQQDGPYGQLLDVSQDVFTCDSAKVQKSPKTPPPLVPPRTFIIPIGRCLSPQYTVGFFFLRSKTLFPALFSGVQIAFRTGLFSP